MRYAILADIHANLAAFEAVLGDIERRGGADQFWNLGDAVGYGPDPQECLDRLLKEDRIGVAGNHDLAATGKIPTASFNTEAAFAAHWAGQRLSPEGKEYLVNEPLVIESGDFTLVHGSPRDPVWEYLVETERARANLDHFKTRYCLVGHSHRPLVFQADEKGDVRRKDLSDGSRLELGERRLIINPGSVGQPRDGDPRASYAIYDTESRSVTIHRVPYDIGLVQSRMAALGLPRRLITRLSYGL
ncbi:MAG: metallophosphoesterase family protein [Chloroflexota bacterium]